MSPVMIMRYRRRADWLLLASGLLIWFLADASQVRLTAADALRLCASSVIPALFPILAVTGMLTAMGFGDWLSPLLSPLMTPLFRLPGQAGSALLLGFLGGYPVGAASAASMYQRGTLTRDEAERLLAFCNNANPAFLLSVLGAGVFGSVRIGIWLLLMQVLSALLTGLLFRGKAVPREKGPRRREIPTDPAPAEGFSKIFVDSVGNAAAAMVRLCGFVVFFSVLTAPMRTSGSRFVRLAAGTLELFSLTPLLTADRAGFVTAAALSAWGGAGVLCQTAAVLEGSGLSPRNCLAGKAVQAVIAAAISAAVSAWIF